MKTSFRILFVILAVNLSLVAQMPESKYRVFEGNGKPSGVDQILTRMASADVVFLGEYHDDAIGHALQFEIFKQAFNSYRKQRDLALSLEMFERDVQIVLDEYRKGLISESHFLRSSRPWGNYQTDYRPLVEFAKENKLEIVAANAPRRYVNMVSRKGRDSLDQLDPEALKWLAPIPFPKPSVEYTEKFNSLMGGHGSENILDSQTLWDATMADAVSRQLSKSDRSLVIHLNGGFHTENRLGTVEQLLNYAPKSRILVVTMRYEEDFKSFDKAKHLNLGDFVILTDAKEPRSKQ
ncbi:MAG: ChaN family lipoprotein [Pyrinomonadaceae bacterium]